MKIKLISFGDGITDVGFRRISSLVKSRYPLTTTYIYNVGGVVAMAKNALFRQKYNLQDNIFINPKFIEEIMDADVIAFSGMTKFAEHIKKAISLTLRNNKALIVWGGIHATVFPENAIQYADAVCIGEGEKSFLSLLKKVEIGEDIDDCEGFWVRSSNGIKRNRLFPLLKNDELSLMPFQDYGFDIQHVTDNSLGPMVKDIYISQEGSKYTTMWSLGCPFHCTYCSNNKFIRNHPDYAKVRYPTAEHKVDEILKALEKHDYINSIDFQDDNFFMVNLDDLRHFASLYKKKIGLPFFIFGLHPSVVNKEKLDIVIKAGAKKLSMGIQSGSKRILSFYGRNTSRETILKAGEILSTTISSVSNKLKVNPPYYDIIIDNPIETKEDKLQTLTLVRELKRPFMLHIYSLRLIPGTELCEFAQNNQQFHFLPIEYTFQSILDKQMGILLFFLSLCNGSDGLFSFLFKISKIPFINELLFNIFKILHFIKKLYYELRISNLFYLSLISPRLPVSLYKLRKWLRRR